MDMLSLDFHAYTSFAVVTATVCMLPAIFILLKGNIQFFSLHSLSRGDRDVISDEKRASEMTEVSLVDVSDFFDREVSNSLRYDLMTICSVLDAVYVNLNALRSQTQALKSNTAGNLSGPQMNKLQKLCDQIESLALFGKEPPILPSAEYLKDLNTKLRNRLRAIEDMLSSTKLGKKDSEWLSSAMVSKSYIQNINSCLDELETLQRKRSVLLQHIDEVKDAVHKPVADLTAGMATQSADDSVKKFAEARQACLDMEEKYAAATSDSELQRSAKIKLQAEFIEGLVNEMLNPLRDAVRSSFKVAGLDLNFVEDEPLHVNNNNAASALASNTPVSSSTAPSGKPSSGKGKKSSKGGSSSGSNAGPVNVVSSSPQSIMPTVAGLTDFEAIFKRDEEHINIVPVLARGRDGSEPSRLRESLLLLWPKRLLKLLSCPHGEFLIRCGKKKTMEEFTEAVEELRSNVSAAFESLNPEITAKVSSENVSAEGGSASSNAPRLSPHSASSINDKNHSNSKAKNKSAKVSYVNNKGNNTSNSSSNSKNEAAPVSSMQTDDDYVAYLRSLRTIAEDIDLEYFRAYLDDWRSRVELIGSITASSEFDLQYSSLIKARTELSRFMNEQQRLEVNCKESLARSSELLKRFFPLKRVVEELALTEIGKRISVKFPSEYSGLLQQSVHKNDS